MKNKTESLSADQLGRISILFQNVVKNVLKRLGLLTADPKSAGERKTILPEEKRKSTNLFTLWDFEGILKYSPMFYGYYTNRDGTEKGYRLPFAYFMTGLLVYIYSFVATLRKMAENSRMSKLSEKDDECVFSWKLLSGWDYMIGNAETAQNRVASIILGFKEALLEEAEKKREPRNWKVIASRVMVNLAVLVLLGVSAYAVVEVVQRSTDEEASKKSFWRRNETTIVMSLITFIFPILFEVLGFCEYYHPRKQLRLQLARIMVLNILNLYSLIFSLFDKIRDMTTQLQKMKNETIYFDTIELTTDIDITTPYNIENQTCYEVAVNCSEIDPLSTASFVLSNLTLLFLFTNLNQTQNITSMFNTSSNIVKRNLVVPPILENQINVKKFKRNVEVESTTDYTEESSDYYENTDDYFDFDYSYDTTETTEKSVTTEMTDFTETTDYYDDDIYFNFDYSTLETSTELSTKTESSTESTTDYYEYETETADYEDSGDYFNFDYGTTKNIITQTIINNLLTTSVTDSTENNTETVTITWNTDELVSEIYSTLNLLNSTSSDDFTGSITEDSTENWNFTDFPENWNATTDMSINITTDNWNDTTYSTNMIDFTTESTENYTENITNITDTEIKNTISDIFKELTTDSTLCRKTQCDPFIVVKNPGSNRIITTKPPSYDYSLRQKLRNLCWETMFGQELVKLTVMDLAFTIISTLAVDFIRAIFVRVMNNCWCWDLEKRFPQYGDFKIAENILHLVNNQGMVWMGMFFSPGLIVINVIKLAIMMYLRSWAVLTCNVPHEVVFKASRSNNFYWALLLTMLFLCVLPVGFAIVWIEPSWHCGPFSNYSRIYHIFTKSLKSALPKALTPFLDYIASPSIVIPLLLLLILIIYYMISLTNALREANNDLKMQLRRERTEERRKMFQLVDRRRRVGSGDSGDMDGTPFGKWKKLLTTLPSSKSFENDTSGKENATNEDNENKDFLVKFIKKAMKKTPEAVSPTADDATDTEQHESLPEDFNTKHHKSERDKKAMNTFRKLLQAKKQHRDAEAAKKSLEMTSTKSSSTENNKNDTKSHKSDKNVSKYRSVSRSSSSKDLRQDSIASNWSDNIPVIKISGTESSECILEHQNESSPSHGRKPRKITHQQNIDVDVKSDDIVVTEIQIAEPQCPLPTMPTSTSSSETLVTIKMDENESENNKTLLSSNENKSGIKNKELSVDTDQSVEKSNSSSSQTKTESSSDYKE